jgi:hypothetical protein
MKEKINAVDLFTIYKDKLKFFNYITRDRNENPKFRFVKCHLYDPILGEDGVWRSGSVGDDSCVYIENLIPIDSSILVFPIREGRVENEMDGVYNPIQVPQYAPPSHYGREHVTFNGHAFPVPPEKSDVKTYK